MHDDDLIRLERRFANDPDGRAVVAEVWRLRQVVGRIAAGVVDPQAVAAEAWERCKVPATRAPGGSGYLAAPLDRTDKAMARLLGISEERAEELKAECRGAASVLRIGRAMREPLLPLLLNLWAIVATTGDEQKHSLIFNPDAGKGEGSLGTSFTAPVNDEWAIQVVFVPRVAPCGCKDGKHECY